MIRITQLTIFALGVIGWSASSMTVHRWAAVLFFLVLFGGQMLFRLMPGLSS